ncbi:MAG: selenide, water dikinase SelD [Candidatus Cloacimonetes bacterium]|nr:selenide, water dikinase SelD [Candidatus Cloacimonadota bacterium]
MKPIYLDYNATTPVAPEVAQAMRPFLDNHFGNPSSMHWYGIQTKKAIENARKQIADLIHAYPDEIIFTSGGSESNNFAIKGIALSHKDRGNHIITSSIEHPSVMEVCEYLESQGFNISYLPVDEYGLVNPKDVEKAITPQTILITIMHANNEVGTIQPISEIAKISKQNDIFVHTDTAQSIGKIPVYVDELGIDLLTIAGHKIYAPKGVGALYIRRGITLQKFIHGADHEQNLRAGTENVLGIVGLGKACEIAGRDLKKNSKYMKKMRDLLHQKLNESNLNFHLNGHPEKRLPNTLSLGFYKVEANTILSEMSGVAASAGAACHSDRIDVSAVLQAMNVPIDYAMGTIRFSTGKFTTEEEIEQAAEIIIKTVQKFQAKKEHIIIDMKEEIKLTHFTHGMGCACKIEPQILETILQKLPIPDDKNILVSTNTADDAAVYKIDENTAIVVTVDFFTPIVDNPFDFGMIATANALSDIYAMGAKPLFGLNIVGFPTNRLPISVLEEILQGAQKKAREAGITIIGGHSIEDTEPKYGMVVVGLVHPEKIWKNIGMVPNDAILLTKPIGTGILSTAMKRGLLSKNQKSELVETMETLNNYTSQILNDFTVHACTDVTGFGLLGHLSEMTKASDVDVEIFADNVKLLNGAAEFATGNIIPGGTLSNLKFVEPIVEWSSSISYVQKVLLSDAQTSGGLLVSIPEDECKELMDKFQKKGIQGFSKIGRVISNGTGKIFVK